MTKKKLFPKKHKGIIADGMSALVKGNIIGAKNKFEELFIGLKKDNIALSPEVRITIISLLAHCYLELKNFKKGFENFYQVLKTDPRFELAHSYLFSIFYRALMMQERKYEDGKIIKKLKPIRQNLRDKNDFASNLLLGVICWMENKPDEMYSYLLNAEKITSNNEYLFYYFAEYYRLKRDFNKALEYFFIFIEQKPESYLAFEGAVECYYEKSIDLLSQGKYEDAKFCLNDGVNFSIELIERIKTRDVESKTTRFHINLIKDDMFYFGKFILFDYQLEKIFSIKSLDELNKTILMVYEYFKELQIAPSKYILSQTVRRLLQIKIFLILIIIDAISFKNPLKKSERVRWIRETRDFFKEKGFIKGKQAIDAIETFSMKLKKYKSLKEISEKDKTELLDLFRPAYVLVRELTLFTVERQKAEIFKADLLSTLKEEIKRSLKTGIKKEKEIEEKKKLEYRVWYKDSEPTGKLIDTKGKEEKVANDKKKYDMFIIRERGLTQIYVKNDKAAPPPGKNTFRILTYVLKNKGNGGTAFNIARHLYDVGEVEKFKDLREMSKATKEQLKLRLAIKEFEEKPGDNVEYYSNRVRQLIASLNKKFLDSLKTNLVANSMDEYELTPPINYCLIEKS